MTQTTSSAGSGMAENVAGLLCYVLGWVTGIIFFLIDKRPYVRFHAAQSIVVFGGLHIINVILGIIFGARLMMGGWGAFGFGAALYSLINLVTLMGRIPGSADPAGGLVRAMAGGRVIGLCRLEDGMLKPERVL